MNNHDLLKEATKKLEDSDVYAGMAQMLLSELYKWYGLDLYAEFYQEANSMIAAEFNRYLERLLNNEPLDYIMGYTSFWGYEFKVDKGALIPRPETEELVSEVLMILDSKKKKLTGLDIGTGCGAIAITLALEAENAKMYACDISREAYYLARENIFKHDANVILKKSDVFSAFSGKTKFDFIVSNPPYIRNDEVLDKSVVDYEPHIALFGGVDGLDLYRRIFKEAGDYLKPSNFLAFEIGFDQADTLIEMAEISFPEAKLHISQDINGKNRMLFIFNNWEYNQF